MTRFERLWAKSPRGGEAPQSLVEHSRLAWEAGRELVERSGERLLRFAGLRSTWLPALAAAVARATFAHDLGKANDHRPRSASPPLVLDLMELFRVSLCDLPLVASLNRGQWRPDLHFTVTRDQAWLSSEGRRLAIDLYERRLAESWKHPVLGYSLSYVRAIELEVRLLEKEWSGEAGLFARSRLR